MAVAITGPLLLAQQSFIRTPVIRALVSRPGYPETTLDISRTIQQCSLILPPNLAAGYTQMTLTNTANAVSGNPLFHPDYVLDLALGYLYRGVRYLQPVGRFYIDEPQRQFTVNPAKNEVVLQARDGFKLFLERHFQADEWIDIRNVPVRDALTITANLVTSAGTPITITFDDDDASQAAFDDLALEEIAGPTDQSKTAYDLLKNLLANRRLQAFFRGDGTLRIGMMNGTDEADAVATLGGVTALARPIFQRNHRRSGREHANQLHVEGDRVWADAIDQANIDDIGRVKYLYVDDPSIDTADHAAVRARQELDLSARFREQPDCIVPWMFDIERRDLITVDDGGVSGLTRAVYRVEDIRYNYQTGAQPIATMQLGLGMPGVEDVTLTTGGI